jgi:hypothetical protein
VAQPPPDVVHPRDAVTNRRRPLLEPEVVGRDELARGEVLSPPPSKNARALIADLAISGERG